MVIPPFVRAFDVQGVIIFSWCLGLLGGVTVGACCHSPSGPYCAKGRQTDRITSSGQHHQPMCACDACIMNVRLVAWSGCKGSRGRLPCTASYGRKPSSMEKAVRPERQPSAQQPQGIHHPASHVPRARQIQMIAGSGVDGQVGPAWSSPRTTFS
jgi:hypothetical protein